jgi:hypothetical protein
MARTARANNSNNSKVNTLPVECLSTLAVILAQYHVNRFNKCEVHEHNLGNKAKIIKPNPENK